VVPEPGTQRFRRALRAGSYTHSVVYVVLLWASFTDRDEIVSVLGWAHGVGWIVMSLACLERCVGAPYRSGWG
jgi:hypothetical protein